MLFKSLLNKKAVSCSKGFSIAGVCLWILLIMVIGYRVCLPIMHYNGIMNDLDQNNVKADLRALFDRDYNYTELIKWEKDHLNFTWDKIDRHTNPLEILEYGKGRCGEFAILYVALCQAHGYQSRLVANILGDHEWAEVKLNDKWIHVDPFEERVNDKQMYERDWKSFLILVCAFESSHFEDVTSYYKMGLWINILSWEMFVVVTTILLLLTWSPIRRRFYIASLSKKKIIPSVGKLYEGHLHYFVVVRLACLFFLPLAGGILLTGNTDSSFLLSLLVIGFALVTFTYIKFPSLTQPKIFISAWEKIEGEDNYYRFLKIDRTNGIKKVRFRIVNLSLHPLKNCTFFITFPESFKIAEYSKEKYEGMDFTREFSFQKTNNACVFKLTNVVLPPQGVFMCTVIFDEVKEDENEHVQIDVCSESTWGDTYDKIPIQNLNKENLIRILLHRIKKLLSR